MNDGGIENSEIKELDDSLSQDDYEETPYMDDTWEIVGEPPKNLDFVPMEVGSAEGEGTFSDPMFADYGGIPTEKREKRWHLPEDVAYVPAEQRRIEEEKQEEQKIPISQVEAIKAQAFEDGRQAGLEQAVTDNVEKYQVLEQNLQRAFLDLKKQFEEQILGTQKNAVSLAVQISKKILEEAVEINPEYILTVVQEAMELSGSAVVKCIRVSPQDLEFIEVVGVDRVLKSDDSTWEFKADDTIKAGCVVETSAGEIDYQLDEAWERIKDKIVGICK